MANVMQEALDRAAERNAEAEGFDAPQLGRRPQPMVNPAPVVHPALLVAVGVLALVALGLLLRPEPAALGETPVPTAVQAAPAAPPTAAPAAPSAAPAAPAVNAAGAMEEINCAAPRDEHERQACADRSRP